MLIVQINKIADNSLPRALNLQKKTMSIPL